MKNFIKILLVIIPILSIHLDVNAQCEKYISFEEDKMSGTGTWVCNNVIVLSHDGGTNGIAITLILSSDGKTIICSNKVVGAGCIDESAKIEILFTDKSRLTLYSDSKFNCQGKATLYFGGVFGKTKYLDDLTEKSVETIRVWGHSSYIQEDFTVEDQDNFKNTIKCLREHQK
jgi:hypothetical protein